MNAHRTHKLFEMFQISNINLEPGNFFLLELIKDFNKQNYYQET